jgi:FAD/FMN-containing dehydrogenase
MHERTLTQVVQRSCLADLRGELIYPGDDGYESARRVWNGMIDKHPDVIVRGKDTVDVVTAIQFARLHHLRVAVRCGGHSVSGSSVCDGGMVIDLSCMKGVHIDPEKQTAWAQAGLTLGEFVQATQAYGLATTTGTVGGTGLSGLTLGGGLGWFMGKYGLTIDNLLEVQLVTADGRVERASAGVNPDLFWAVRGGGGNFGIATAFSFQLHPVGPVLAGKVVYPMKCAREVLRFYREYTSTAPDELTAYASLSTTPDGLPAVAISLCYCGPLKDGERAVAPVRRFAAPLVDLIRPRSYLKLITQADAGAPNGRHYYEKASTLKHLSDEAIETLADYGAACTSPSSLILIQHVHGAASRVSPTATAFALREESYVISMLAAWNGGEAARHSAWARACWRALTPFASSGVYVNFLGNEGEERVRAAYGVNYERLVALKNTYDPTNFFARNQNIRPTVSKPRPLAQDRGVLAG